MWRIDSYDRIDFELLLYDRWHWKTSDLSISGLWERKKVVTFLPVAHQEISESICFVHLPLHLPSLLRALASMPECMPNSTLKGATPEEMISVRWNQEKILEMKEKIMAARTIRRQLNKNRRCLPCLT